MTEQELQKAVCQYMRLQHPGVLFHSDVGSGVKLTKYQAATNKMMQLRRGWPDIFIPEPRGAFYGLFVELKKDGTKVYTRSGGLAKDEHLEEQAEWLSDLCDRGYLAVWAVGFDQAKQKIDEYLKLGKGERVTYSRPARQFNGFMEKIKGKDWIV